MRLEGLLLELLGPELVLELALQRAHDELIEEGFEVRMPKIGVMIEVPSAVLLADYMAEEADFFSIGTNDLIQYTLAIDRGNPEVSHLFSPLHPALLRMLKQITETARGHGIETYMCGEMAAGPLMVPVLVGLGLRRFSMNPQALPVIRNLIRQLSFRESVHIARQVVKMSTAREVEEFLLERLAIFLAKTKIRV